MKKVLIVSYVFPPMAAVGGQRVVNFCKFLPRFGWTPVVLTVKGGVNSAWDETPLKKIPETIIYRTPTYEPLLRREFKKAGPKPAFPAPATDATVASPPLRKLSFGKRLKRFFRFWLTVPDQAIFWIPLGLFRGLRVIRKEKISVIWSSSPPVSAHLLASLLARLSGLPHIADFRDLWTLNHNYDQRGYPGYIKKYDAFWERSVLKRAVKITTASPGFTRQMEAHLHGMLKNRVTTITNGFDYEEVPRDKEFSMSAGKLRFLYTGTIYSYFNPVFFLEGLAGWVKTRALDKSHLQVDFYGNYDYDYNGWVRDLGLEAIVRFHGFLPRAELLPIYLQADYLLLLLGFRPQNANVIPAKMFEYLASGAKIFALAPRGVVTEMIDKYNAGFYISEPDQAALHTLLDKIYESRSRNLPPVKKYRYIKDIDRIYLTERLAGILNEVTL